jgi:hypothetical protein
MARKKNQKKKTNKKKTANKSESKRKILIWGLVVITLVVAVGITIVKTMSLQSGETHSQKKSASGEVMREPKFEKEGELLFLKEDSSEIKKIDIEISETPNERQMGLMYRTSMPDSVGMLFIFERPHRQYFWMKNTYISLDIIYADEKKKIVSIQKYTIPFSEDPIPSYYSAKYVIEVTAGFCDKNKIAVGDSFRFSRN